MQKHITLARKYRPQSLCDIVGQEILVQTIRNAISFNRLPQALLLTGTRGIGKTTTARIIAKYLNCSEVKSGQDECCNKCDSCIAIASCSHPDVLEFDAASNTSVNDIREIIETISYKPLKSKYKFYIIDEVHMLSNSAFNALLKTLEEPPLHVRFILATTEEHKVPMTVLSRCLQFKLKPIQEQVIARRCNDILKSEGILSESEATQMIANAANGSMRDALSILEGVIAFCANSSNIIQSEVAELLGYNHLDNIQNIFDLLCEGNITECLERVKNLCDEGMEPMLIASELLNIIHKITIHNLQNKATIEIPFLLRAWHVISELIQTMKGSENHRVQLEMSLIKLAHLNVNDIDDSREISNSSNTHSISTLSTSMQSCDNIMNMLIEKAQEELPSVQKIKLLYPESDFLQKSKQIKTFNNLRVLLAYLLNIGEAILYHRLSSVVRVIDLNFNIKRIVVSSHSIKSLESDLKRVTRVEWSVIVENNTSAMTYSEFLSILDKQHENALLQTDVVKYILNKFDDFKVKNTKLNNNYIH